jgi:CheY-like chemotaxis protein
MAAVPPIRILVIEDDTDTQANLCDILELDAHRVETAASIVEALNRANWADYSAILLDRLLPDGNAEELLPRLKELAPDAVILVVTGYADLGGAIAALRLGAADYILKPVNADALKDLKAGYHAFSVLGTDGKGNIRPSNPVLVVVRKPAESLAARAAAGAIRAKCLPSGAARAPEGDHSSRSQTDERVGHAASPKTTRKNQNPRDRFRGLAARETKATFLSCSDTVKSPGPRPGSFGCGIGGALTLLSRLSRETESPEVPGVGGSS